MRRRIITVTKAGSSNRLIAMKIKSSEERRQMIRLIGVNGHELIRSFVS